MPETPSRTASPAPSLSTSPTKSPASRPSSRLSNSGGGSRSFTPTALSDDPAVLKDEIHNLRLQLRRQHADIATLQKAVRASKAQHPVLSTAVTGAPPPPEEVRRRRKSSIDAAALGRIWEGVPQEGGTSPDGHKRKDSVGVSRIPVSSVGLGRALTNDHLLSPPHPTTSSPSPAASPNSQAFPRGVSSPTRASSSSSASAPSTPTTNGTPVAGADPLGSPFPLSPLSPGESRIPIGTGRVIKDLQNELASAKTALDSTRAQLRTSQKAVAASMKEVEDQKEARERLRLEVESMGAMVARRERQLSDMTDRAKSAETSLEDARSTLGARSSALEEEVNQLKAELAKTSEIAGRSEREYRALQGSLDSLTQKVQGEVDALRRALAEREAVHARERADERRRAEEVLQLVEERDRERTNVAQLLEDAQARNAKFGEAFEEELARVRAQLGAEEEKTREAVEQTSVLTAELQRIRRLMRAYRPDAADEADPEPAAGTAASS